MKGLQGDVVLVEGVSYGKATVAVGIVDPIYAVCTARMYGYLYEPLHHYAYNHVCIVWLLTWR